MKHADGDTMTHMLRLTASDLDVALKEEEEKHTHTHTWREFQDAPRGPFSQSLRVHVRTYWFDLRENALSLLIAGPWQIGEDGEEGGRQVSSGVARGVKERYAERESCQFEEWAW